MNRWNLRWDLSGCLVSAAHRRDLGSVRPEAFAALSARERGRVECLSDDRADDVILGRYLLRTLAREILQLPDHTDLGSIEIDASCPRCGQEHGHPRFPGREIVASVTHSGGLVMAAIATTTTARAIGIDTEPLGAGGLTNEAVRTWTQREALAKLSGDGLLDPADDGHSSAIAHPPGVRFESIPTAGWITTLAVARP